MPSHLEATSKQFLWVPAAVLPLLLTAFAFQVTSAGDDPVDHAAVIRAWDRQPYERGEAIYRDNCAQCHGANALAPPNPTAAAFASDELQNGSDPYSMWTTITEGYRLMPSQAWLSPRQRYDVIHYIREAFFKTSNRSQYTPITAAYLDSLPDPGAVAEENRPEAMEYGPALTYELESSRSALILPLSGEVSTYYDLHTMAAPVAWTGDFIDLSKTHHVEYKGGERATIAGERLGLGAFRWAFRGSFDDPRTGYGKLGPVPEEAVQYEGHYLHGESVVLEYEVSGRGVLDMPSARSFEGLPVLSHTLKVAPGDEALELSLGRRASGAGAQRYSLAGEPVEGRAGPAHGSLLAVGRDTVIAAGVAGAPAGAELRVTEHGRLVLTIPRRTEPVLIKVFRAAGTDRRQVLAALGSLVESAVPLTNPEDLTEGGPRRWTETVTTTGRRSSRKNAYVLDSLGVPLDNPWQSWMRLTALDFFDDGRAAVTTLNGDVWIVSGIDASLDRLTWQRFAAGLYEPLGVKVVDGQVYVQGRDRITRLHDKNGDGEADYYESFYPFDYVSRGYHAFTFGLDTDSQGHFYTAMSGRKTDVPFPGYVLRVAPDGASAEMVAMGFRHPNGLTVGPDDGIYVSDNQGGWIPASKLSYVREGRFYGYPGWEERQEPHDDFEEPIFWVPQELDNSSGGPVWVSDPRWGPLAGRLLHTSYGAGRAFYTVIQQVDGTLQGGVVPFPWQFPSGLMRARVNPRDGQVYLVGQKGWGTRGQLDGSLHRIRYTGEPARLITDAEVTRRGIRLRFSAPLDADAAADTSRYVVRRWNYKWTSSYGSPHYLPTDSSHAREGEETVPLRAARVGEDRRTVLLTLEKNIPVDQMQIDVDVPAEDGTPVQQSVYLTIKKIPGTDETGRASSTGPAPEN